VASAPSAYGLGGGWNGEEARASGEDERSCGDESADNGGEDAKGCVQEKADSRFSKVFLLRVAQIMRLSYG
jgi:hypothetical protein